MDTHEPTAKKCFETAQYLGHTHERVQLNAHVTLLLDVEDHCVLLHLEEVPLEPAKHEQTVIDDLGALQPPYWSRCVPSAAFFACCDSSWPNAYWAPTTAPPPTSAVHASHVGARSNHISKSLLKKKPISFFFLSFSSVLHHWRSRLGFGEVTNRRSPSLKNSVMQELLPDSPIEIERAARRWGVGATAVGLVATGMAGGAMYFFLVRSSDACYRLD